MYEFSTFSVFKFISLPLPLRFYCNEITTLMFNSFSSFIYIYIYIYWVATICIHKKYVIYCPLFNSLKLIDFKKKYFKTPNKFHNENDHL